MAARGPRAGELTRGAAAGRVPSAWVPPGSESRLEVRLVATEMPQHRAGLLRDVDVLARRYGWSEREILGLGAARRGLTRQV